jgi:hypothetical protein
MNKANLKLLLTDYSESYQILLMEFMKDKIDKDDFGKQLEALIDNYVLKIIEKIGGNYDATN